MTTGNPSKLRSFDKAPLTRKTCIYGLAASWLLIWGCCMTVIAISNAHDHLLPGAQYSPGVHQDALLIILPLLLAILVTFCNECLGLIHTVSLRWALLHEGRLHFNTNLRLLTAARRSRPNAWYVNLFSTFMTAVSYTAAGQSMAVVYSEPPLAITFNLPAIGILISGLSSQAAIATWAVVVMKRRTPTWSANPLNNSLACQHDSLQHHTGRSLVPYQKGEISEISTSAKALKRQRSLGNTRPAAVMVVGLLWFVAAVTLLGAGIFQSQNINDGHRGPTGSYSVIKTGHHLTWAFYPHDPSWLGSLIAILFSLATQVGFTFTLHCAELLVNATRDEKTWRDASKLRGKGARVSTGAIKEACTSWETIFLFLLKIAVHWTFGEGVVVFFVSGAAIFSVWSRTLFFLFALMVVVAIFGSWLCFRRFSGPQPAAYGHLQTLADLIDDWGKDDQPIYWGDKGHITQDAEGEIRHAGTAGSLKMLGRIRMDAKYI